MSSISQKEAIYLFTENAVCQGFWLSEFEQLIRDKAQIGHFSNVSVKAAYVVIGAQDFAQAMVLFQLPINDRGFVNSDWYLPLRRLADSAGHGPNMGDGRIRLACQSQCSISWHKDAMWEPVTSDFMAIRKAIRDNMIGQKPLTLSSAQVNFSESSTLLKSNNGTRVASAMSKRHEDPDVENLKNALKTETLAYRNQLQQLQTELERQKSITAKIQRESGGELLEKTNSGEVLSGEVLSENRSAADLENSRKEAAREALEEKLKQELAEIKQIHLAEMKQHQQEMSDMKQQLAQQQEAYEALQLTIGQEKVIQQTQEVELITEQLSRTQQALAIAEEKSIEHFISRVDALEAVMVCFHPGAGHLTINAESMQSYTENPTAYAAKKCHVDENLYATWLDHYDDPKCLECGCEIPRIEHPKDFQQHLQGFCNLHRSMRVRS